MAERTRPAMRPSVVNASKQAELKKHTEPVFVPMKFMVTKETRNAVKMATLRAKKGTMKQFAMEAFKGAGVEVAAADLEDAEDN